MRRHIAKEIALKITNEELFQMLKNAKNGIKDWTVVSLCNKSFTKGVAWNILTKNFDVNNKLHLLHKINLVREFGEFLPSELKPKPKVRPKISPKHQEPKFEF